MKKKGVLGENPRVVELGDLKGPEYKYLGHFAKKEFQREGHNFMKSRKGANVLSAISEGIASMAPMVMGAMGSTAPETTPKDLMPETAPPSVGPDKVSIAGEPSRWARGGYTLGNPDPEAGFPKKLRMGRN